MRKDIMPVVFTGHGSPMIALEKNNITEEMENIGKYIIENYGKPKAILAISAHWYTNKTYVQSTPKPRQIYDMYGFPQELYDLKYTVKGFIDLTKQLKDILGEAVNVNDNWGIDHGTWTVLVHMFPKADIPVVQLSVNGKFTAKDSYELGKKLTVFRENGYLILGSGNIVHNLSEIEWDNEGGSDRAVSFDDDIRNAVLEEDIQKLIEYNKLPYASYAVPTPDHFLPLLYCIGATKQDNVKVFNNVCNLGSIAMTGYIFEAK